MPAGGTWGMRDHRDGARGRRYSAPQGRRPGRGRLPHLGTREPRACGRRVVAGHHPGRVRRSRVYPRSETLSAQVANRRLEVGANPTRTQPSTLAMRAGTPNKAEPDVTGVPKVEKARRNLCQTSPSKNSGNKAK